MRPSFGQVLAGSCLLHGGAERKHTLSVWLSRLPHLPYVWAV